MRTGFDKTDCYPWWFAGIGRVEMVEITEWCVEQFGPMPPYDRWATDVHSGNSRWSYSVHFRREQDALWFKLRWYTPEAE